MAVAPHLDPAGRDGIIDLLVAVDELMFANAAALEAVKRASPGIDVSPYDLSFVQDNLELFSRDVDLVDIRENAEQAEVTVQISGRLPLVRLRFERHEGVWQYLPGPENPEIVRAIRELAKTVQQIEAVVSRSSLTARQIDREYKLRLGRRLKRLAALADTATVQDVASLP